VKKSALSGHYVSPSVTWCQLNCLSDSNENKDKSSLQKAIGEGGWVSVNKDPIVRTLQRGVNKFLSVNFHVNFPNLGAIRYQICTLFC
jgi:hypothetical protein